MNVSGRSRVLKLTNIASAVSQSSLFRSFDLPSFVAKFQILFGMLRIYRPLEARWSRGSALDFRWFEPGFCRCLVSLEKNLYYRVSLFTQVYQWVPVITMLGSNLAMNWHPIHGGITIFPVASCYRNRKRRPDGPLGL